jgi:hypothetical protein
MGIDKPEHLFYVYRALKESFGDPCRFIFCTLKTENSAGQPPVPTAFW